MHNESIHSNTAVWTTAVLLVLGTLGVAVSRAQEPATQAPAAPAGFVLAAGPGLTEFQTTCTACHTPDRIVAVRRTRIEWEEILDKMVTRGAQITDTNYTPIEDYLLRNYGKTNVNKAPKDDLVLVCGLTPEEADTVLAFRKEHGPFADFDALLAVPAIDAKKLKDRRDALTF